MIHLKLPSGSLEDTCEQSLSSAKEHLTNFKVHPAIFTEASGRIIANAHRLAFTIAVWESQLRDNPPHATPYLSEIRSDAIELIHCITIGSGKGCSLHMRAMIEGLWRYIYYSDHPVEHLLLQNKPRDHLTIKELHEWVSNYPTIEPIESGPVNADRVFSLYSELSQRVHATVSTDMTQVDKIETLALDGDELEKIERKLLAIGKALQLLLVLFHKETIPDLDAESKDFILSWLDADVLIELQRAGRV